VQFGRVQDIVNDCCGYCPVPKTDEEKEIAEEEAKNYVSGKISFMKDDPGRQVSVIHIVTFSALFLNSADSWLANRLFQPLDRGRLD